MSEEVEFDELYDESEELDEKRSLQEEIEENGHVEEEETEENDFEVETTMTVGEAVAELNELEQEYAVMQNRMLHIRWRQGEIAAHVDIKYGENTIEKLAEEIDLHPNTLRECIRLYKHFRGDKSRFEEWMEEAEKSRRWYEVQSLIRSNSDPRVLGPEALRDRIIRRIERTGQDLEKISEYAQQGDMEAQGALSRAVEEVAYFGEHGINAFERTEDVPRSDNYLDWVREQPCIVTGSADVHAHHVKKAGTGIKGSDYLAIPLDVDLHNEYHNIGKESFEDKYNVDMRHLCLETLHLYITGQGAFQNV